jgi:uncharacterized protein (DUF305 family)
MRARLTLLAVAVVLAGCGEAKPERTPGEKVIQPGAPGEPSREVVATPIPEGYGTTPADIAFMRDMIHHHQQAVTMAEWVPERSKSSNLKLFAKRMAVTQQDELTLMRSWLDKRGENADDHSQHQNTMMPGMLTPEQMDELEAAKGKAFDRLFLRYMTQHHQGALAMVQSLVDQGGGAEAELEQFILHVDSDQSIEISRMRQMLADL